MLIIVVGARGSGKTLFLTERALKSSRPVWSNFKIDCSRYHKVDVVDLLTLPNEIELLLDEAYTWLESRASGRSLNKYLSYIAFQLRKRNMNIFLTVQQFSTIDVRYRNEWDMIVRCERLRGRNGELKDFRYSFLSREFRMGKAVYRTSSWRLPYERAKDLFQFYDTEEIVEPYDKSKLELDLLKNDPERFFKKVRAVAEEVLPTLNVITRDSVRIGLLQLGYDNYYSQYVYAHLKGMVNEK